VTSARRGPIIAGTWLVGLGLVFFFQRALDIGWGEAWPMFVILVGVASLVSIALEGVRGVAGIWAFTWPVVVILIGIGLLAATTGYLGQGPIDWLATWWPLGLVVLGVWFVIGALIPIGREPLESLAVPLDGAAAANVRLRFGAGHLIAHRAGPGNLVDGSFEGGVIRKDFGPGQIELRQDTTYGMPWFDRRSDWQIGLTGEVPLDLRLDTGASAAELDLLDLQARSIELHTGASSTRMRLPRAAGRTTVRADSGAASLVIEVPEGVAARIRTRMGLGSSQIDERRFPRSTDGYESLDYGTAANRVDIDLTGGVGSVKVIGSPAT
jgi:hypothetical protein